MLKILGILFLVLIGLVLAFFVWLFFKARGGMQQHARIAAIEEGMSTPPIVLEPIEQPSLAHPEAIALLVQQAMQLGATSCGNYDAPAAGARVCAYCLDTPPVYIAIYDHDQADPWADVVLRVDRDRTFTVSTVSEVARGAPRHPDDEVIHFAPGTDLGALVQAAAEHANSGAALSAAPEAFKEFFEAAAEKSRKYIETEGVSQAWLKTIAQDAGVELAGDEAEQINYMREERQAMQTEIDCLKSLAESGEFTAAQWDDMRENLVAVWDEMPDEYVPAVIYNHVDIPEDMETAVDALEDGNGSARERVATLNATIPAEQRLVLVGRVSSPVTADIYRDQIPVF